MRMTVKVYKNSRLATLVNMLGEFMMMGFLFGVVMLMIDPIGAVLCIIIGVCGIFLVDKASEISENKVFKEWLKANANINLEERIRASADFARKAYDSCPNRSNLKFITSLNPEAGAQIAASIGKK